MSRTPAAVALALVLAAASLAGCTGVPSDSAPQAIDSQALEQALPSPNGPPAGADARDIVSDFLDQNALNDVNHNVARQYLTSSARSRWSDDRVTVVSSRHVGVQQADDTVSVDGTQLGSVDPNGSYTPVLSGDGSTGAPYHATFSMKQVHGEWRVDKLPAGLLVTADQFGQEFQQRAIYFYDASEQRLVPDARYTQILDPDGLSNWLLRSLATGPRDALTGAEVSELPAQTDPKSVSVTGASAEGAAARVVIPGAAQLDAPTRTKLAVEVAATLEQVAEIGTTRSLTIQDGTAAVPIPDHGTTFTAGDFAARIDPPRPVPQLYYVNDAGGVVDQNGQPLPGRVGSGYYDLTSIALAAGRTDQGLLVAATRGKPGSQTFDIGPASGELIPVPGLRGRLSRPTWAPDANEAWVGDGSVLYRVALGGTAQAVPMSTPSGPAAGRIAAVRFSPEGTRLAVVLQSDDSGGRLVSQVWIGAVVRGSGKVQLEGLTPVTATGIEISDVAWNDELKLFATGHDASTLVSGIYEVQCDGSRWSARGTGILPGEPDSITVAPGQVAAVSSDNTVWKQLAGTWESPQGDETRGRSPVYVE